MNIFTNDRYYNYAQHMKRFCDIQFCEAYVQIDNFPIFSQVWLPFSDTLATVKMKINTHLKQLSYCSIYQSENMVNNNFHNLVLHIALKP